MTIESRDFEDTLTADGVTSAFPFTFPPLKTNTPGEFVIVVNLTDDPGAPLVQGTDYSVNLNSSGIGGTVTLTTPPDLDDEIHIYRLIQPFQLTRFITNQDISAPILEFCFDKVTVLIQQLETIINFVIHTTIPGLLSILNLASVVRGGIPVFTTDESNVADVIVPVQAGYVLTDNGVGELPTFQPNAVTVISLGSMVVPGVTTPRSVVLWNAADGTAIKNGPAIGTAGQVFSSNGAGSDPSFEDLLDLLADAEPGTAGQVLTSNGPGVAATFEDLPSSTGGDNNLGSFTEQFRWVPNPATSGATHVMLTSGGIVPTNSSAPDSTSGGILGSKYVIHWESTGAGDDMGLSAALTLDTTSIDVKFKCRIGGLDFGGLAYRVFVGLVSNVATQEGQDGPQNLHCAGFRYATATDVSNTNWRCVTNDGGNDAGTVTDSTVDSGFAAALGSDLAFHVRSGAVDFYIGEVLVATHTTNLPSGSNLSLMISVRDVGGAGSLIRFNIQNIQIALK